MPRLKATKPRPRKTRRARGTGCITWDRRAKCWLGKVKVGRYPNGRTKYTEVRAATQEGVVELMKTTGPPRPATTLGEWAERWFKRSGAQAQTKADYRTALDKHILPALGARRVADLTADDVEAAVNGWTTGANTSNKNLRVLRTLLDAARKAKLVPENVARDARGRKPQKVKIDPFDPPQLKRIVAEAGARPGDAAIALLAAVGCRMGEAVALEVADWDAAAGTVSVTKTYDRKFGARRPKSENGIRTIKVPAVARPALDRAAAGRKTGPLFAARSGRHLAHDTLRDRWRALLERLGYRYRNPHQLRHSVATHALANKVPLANVARDLGDSPETILRTYGHPTADCDVCSAMDALFAACK